MLLIQADLPGDWTTGRALVAATCIGCGAAVVEGASHHGIDNLTVQLAASGIAWTLALTPS